MASSQWTRDENHPHIKHFPIQRNHNRMRCSYLKISNENLMSGITQLNTFWIITYTRYNSKYVKTTRTHLHFKALKKQILWWFLTIHAGTPREIIKFSYQVKENPTNQEMGFFHKVSIRLRHIPCSNTLKIPTKTFS